MFKFEAAAIRKIGTPHRLKIILLLSITGEMKLTEMLTWLAGNRSESKRASAGQTLREMARHRPVPFIRIKRIGAKGEIRRVVVLNQNNVMAVAVGLALLKVYPKFGAKINAKRARIAKAAEKIEESPTGIPLLHFKKPKHIPRRRAGRRNPLIKVKWDEDRVKPKSRSYKP